MNLSVEQKRLLNNPFYNALTTLQQDFAEIVGNVVRYRPEVLPFAGVASGGVVVDAANLRQDTDTIFTGVLPEIEADIDDAKKVMCLQMAWEPARNFTVPNALLDESELGSKDADDMVELISVAFPGYYRPESYKLGRFIGIRIDGQLVAMAGHRTSMPGLREISAVCTRPGYTGRGYAQHLIQRLLIDTPNARPYLHTLSSNTRAISIYEGLGFVSIGEIPLLHIPQRQIVEEK